jgi:hypothetical protein
VEKRKNTFESSCYAENFPWKKRDVPRRFRGSLKNQSLKNTHFHGFSIFPEKKRGSKIEQRKKSVETGFLFSLPSFFSFSLFLKKKEERKREMHQNGAVEEMAKSVEEMKKTVEKKTISVEWV